jgi:hypothetical protein
MRTLLLTQVKAAAVDTKPEKPQPCCWLHEDMQWRTASHSRGCWLSSRLHVEQWQPTSSPFGYEVGGEGTAGFMSRYCHDERFYELQAQRSRTRDGS